MTMLGDYSTTDIARLRPVFIQFCLTRGLGSDAPQRLGPMWTTLARQAIHDLPTVVCQCTWLSACLTVA